MAWGHHKLNGGSYLKLMYFHFLGNIAIVSEDLVVTRSPDYWRSLRESMFANIALVLGTNWLEMDDLMVHEISEKCSRLSMSVVE